ncbi:MAG: ABC transporter permease [Geminicoccaceae bacterium]|nr:ABC transporter permease [Geminicoccaceae bacterium]
MAQQATLPISGHELPADAQSLKARLRKSERTNKWRAFLFVVPLLLFILITFIIPIGSMLYRSIDNPQVVETIPRTAAMLADWTPPDPPSEDVFKTLVAELRSPPDPAAIGKLAVRINYEVSGASSLFRKTERRLKRLDDAAPYREQLIKIDKDWADPELWAAIKSLDSPLTGSYFLAATDMTRNVNGEIEMQPGSRQIYLTLFWRTFWLSGFITLMTLLLGFPIAHLLAILPLRTGNLLMILVLLPFWTSLLVRTTSWIVLLQTNGVLNDLLVWLGIISNDNRIRMIYNKAGTVIAMTHILLPFMILPLYSVMRTIKPTYMRAARSLGATQWTAFWRVYVPQTLPGVGAGAILVFILAIGYYITPALVGGQDGQLISNMIAYHMQTSLNWGLAAALGSLLLGAVLVLYFVYNRLVGIENMKLG